MNTQKKQLIIATVTVLIFCAVTLTGLFLLPVFSTSATSVGGDNHGNYVYPELTAPASVNAPKKIEGLVYNGLPQALITAGQDDITYSLDQDGDFTSEIPTAINAGSYYVYYKVAGDNNIYNLHNTISKLERSVSCVLESWHYNQRANEPTIDLPISDGVTEPQITYYQKNGKLLYEKPTTVGQYTIKVFVPASTNYAECTTTQDFKIFSHISLSFDAAFFNYQEIEVSLGEQTPLTISPRHGATLFNALPGTQTLTVTADGEVIFQQVVINAEQNQQIIVKG